MRLIEHVLGGRLDSHLSERLHRLNHDGGTIDRLMVRSAEIQRRRFRAQTEKGEEVAVALPREQTLFDGAVLACEEDYALLVEVLSPRWLRCVPRDKEAALELAYNAGNLHWRVKFDGAVLLVAQEGAVDAYRARLRRLIDAGAVRIEEPDGPAAC